MPSPFPNQAMVLGRDQIPPSSIFQVAAREAVCYTLTKPRAQEVVVLSASLLATLDFRCFDLGRWGQHWISKHMVLFYAAL